MTHSPFYPGLPLLGKADGGSDSIIVLRLVGEPSEEESGQDEIGSDDCEVLGEARIDLQPRQRAVGDLKQAAFLGAC